MTRVLEFQMLSKNIRWYRSDSETHSNTLSFATTKPGLRAGSLFHLGVRVGGTGY